MEKGFDILGHESHVVAFARAYRADSSFAYHHLSEVFDHHRYKTGHDLSTKEKKALVHKVVARDGHLWLKDIAHVGMYWLRRRQEDLCTEQQ
jgi:hypothetical protein